MPPVGFAFGQKCHLWKPGGRCGLISGYGISAGGLQGSRSGAGRACRQFCPHVHETQMDSHFREKVFGSRYVNFSITRRRSREFSVTRHALAVWRKKRFRSCVVLESANKSSSVLEFWTAERSSAPGHRQSMNWSTKAALILSHLSQSLHHTNGGACAPIGPQES